MLLFRSGEHVDRWCRQWGLPRGEMFSLDQQWGLARGWYADRLTPDWRRKTADEGRALFRRLGLDSDFWRVGD